MCIFWQRYKSAFLPGGTCIITWDPWKLQGSDSISWNDGNGVDNRWQQVLPRVIQITQCGQFVSKRYATYLYVGCRLSKSRIWYTSSLSCQEQGERQLEVRESKEKFMPQRTSGKWWQELGADVIWESRQMMRLMLSLKKDWYS